MADYNKHKDAIAHLCGKFGYKACQHCPLFNACIIEKEDGESEKDFTARWESTMAKAYETEILNLQRQHNGTDHSQ